MNCCSKSYSNTTTIWKQCCQLYLENSSLVTDQCWILDVRHQDRNWSKLATLTKGGDERPPLTRLEWIMGALLENKTGLFTIASLHWVKKPKLRPILNWWEFFRQIANYAGLKKLECQSRVSKKEHVKILHGVLHVSIVNLIADNMILFVVTIIYFFCHCNRTSSQHSKGYEKDFQRGYNVIVSWCSLIFSSTLTWKCNSFAPLQITPLIRSPQFSCTLNTKIF